MCSSASRQEPRCLSSSTSRKASRHFPTVLIGPAYYPCWPTEREKLAPTKKKPTTNVMIHWQFDEWFDLARITRHQLFDIIVRLVNVTSRQLSRGPLTNFHGETETHNDSCCCYCLLLPLLLLPLLLQPVVRSAAPSLFQIRAVNINIDITANFKDFC